jgi:hypothetical protein
MAADSNLQIPKEIIDLLLTKDIIIQPYSEMDTEISSDSSSSEEYKIQDEISKLSDLMVVLLKM